MEVWFEDLTYRTPGSRKRKKLLDDVSGRFLPGQLTAILGPSGAGKTTLLNAISGYNQVGVSGEIFAGSKGSCCYISQEDLLIPLLTAGELMAFASRLKLPASFTAKERAIAVENVMSSLGLEDISDTRSEKLSGGQRRRLTIALELINNPPVLFMDEPTSGLDNVTTNQLVKLLSRISRDGRTIVITIHQPSASIFDLFDRVYLLAQGRCIYQGGPGSHLLSYLKLQGFVCPIHHSPPDFVIELTEDKKNVEILSEASKNGKISWYTMDTEKNGKITTTDYNPKQSELRCNQVLEYEDVSCRSFWVQFSAIFHRTLLQAWRNQVGIKLQIIHHLGVGALLGLMFFQNTNDGSLFFCHLKLCMATILFHAYTMQMIPILYLPFELKVLKKEHFNKWYSLFPYYLGFSAAKIPLMVVLNLFYNAIVYSLIGLPWNIDRYLYFSLIGLMTALVAEGVGLTIGSVFSAKNGCVIGPLSIAPFLGLAIYGFDFMHSMSPLMDFFTQTSYIRSGIVATVIIMFGLERPNLDCPLDNEICLYRYPNQVFHFLTLERWSIPLMCFYLFLNFVFYRTTFYLALKWRLRR